jgi:hypothetical protein
VWPRAKLGLRWRAVLSSPSALSVINLSTVDFPSFVLKANCSREILARAM